MGELTPGQRAQLFALIARDGYKGALIQRPKPRNFWGPGS